MLQSIDLAMSGKLSDFELWTLVWLVYFLLLRGPGMQACGGPCSVAVGHTCVMI